MPLAMVTQVVFGADAAHTRGALRRPTAPAHSRKPVDTPASPAPLEDMEADADEADAPRSTAGLSILAQALAAYSQA